MFLFFFFFIFLIGPLSRMGVVEGGDSNTESSLFQGDTGSTGDKIERDEAKREQNRSGSKTETSGGTGGETTKTERHNTPRHTREAGYLRETEQVRHIR